MQHLAAVMDGNRRWGKRHGLTSLEGHTKGVEAVRKIVAFCLKNNIPYLSLYTFSLENFRRSEEEKGYLFSLIALQAEKNLDEFLEKNVRVRFVGDRQKFPVRVRDVCRRVETQTAHLKALCVNFLFCYGGQQEVVAATKEIARKIAAGKMSVDDICPETIRKHSWLGDIPEPEVIVRPGAVPRISNFLLFHAAYSEIFFTDRLWPDVDEAFLEKVVADFKKIKRNFGR